MNNGDQKETTVFSGLSLHFTTLWKIQSGTVQKFNPVQYAVMSQQHLVISDLL